MITVKRSVPAPRGGTYCQLGCQGSARSNFVAAEPPGTENRAERAGNLGGVGQIAYHANSGGELADQADELRQTMREIKVATARVLAL